MKTLITLILTLTTSAAWAFPNCTSSLCLAEIESYCRQSRDYAYDSFVAVERLKEPVTSLEATLKAASSSILSAIDQIECPPCPDVTCPELPCPSLQCPNPCGDVSLTCPDPCQPDFMRSDDLLECPDPVVCPVQRVVEAKRCRYLADGRKRCKVVIFEDDFVLPEE